MINQPKTIIMGLGYIGLPTAALIAKNRLNVLGVDVNEKVINTIRQGKIHIVEPDLEGIVRSVVEHNFLEVALQPQAGDVFIITVPTPLREQQQPDISYVVNATEQLIPYLAKGNLLIIESTCPVGTTEKMAELIYNQRPELNGEIHIAYCPERVLPGRIIYELEHNDRVIGGIDNDSTQAAIRFYQHFVKGQLHATNARTAEMCKLTENSFRDVNIAFANELSIIAGKADINVWELIELANRHPRVNILKPGTGVGGHCIAIDPWFLVSDFKDESQLIHTARQVNTFKTQWVVEKIKSTALEFELKHQRPANVALLGLAFKADIDDLRESPALFVAQYLLSANIGNVLVSEPNIQSHNEIELTNHTEAYQKADIVVFLVPHREFKLIKKDNTKTELDFCGARQS